MDNTERKLRARLERAKGGHKRVLQQKLDKWLRKSAVAVEQVAEVAPAPAPKPRKKRAKKATKKD